MSSTISGAVSARLVELVEERSEKLEGTTRSANSNSIRKRAWQEIAEILCAENPGISLNRDKVTKHWYYVKSQSKSKNAEIKKVKKNPTGGGPPPPSLTPAEEKVIGIYENSVEFKGVEGFVESPLVRNYRSESATPVGYAASGIGDDEEEDELIEVDDRPAAMSETPTMSSSSKTGKRKRGQLAKNEEKDEVLSLQKKVLRAQLANQESLHEVLQKANTFFDKIEEYGILEAMVPPNPQQITYEDGREYNEMQNM